MYSSSYTNTNFESSLNCRGYIDPSCSICMAYHHFSSQGQVVNGSVFAWFR